MGVKGSTQSIKRPTDLYWILEYHQITTHKSLCRLYNNWCLCKSDTWHKGKSVKKYINSLIFFDLWNGPCQIGGTVWSLIFVNCYIHSMLAHIFSHWSYDKDQNVLPVLQVLRLVHSFKGSPHDKSGTTCGTECGIA